MLRAKIVAPPAFHFSSNLLAGACPVKVAIGGNDTLQVRALTAALHRCPFFLAGFAGFVR